MCLKTRLEKMSIKIEDNATDILRKAMLGYGISTEELAYRSHLPLSEIRRLRTQKASPETLEILAPILNLDPGKLKKLDSIFALPVKEPIFPKALFRIEMPCGNKVLPNMKSNAYVLADFSNKSAVVFDCGMNAETLLNILRKNDLTPRALFLTHLHFDHADGREEIRNTFPRTEIFSYENSFSDSNAPQKISADKFQIRAIPVPGHTEDSVVYAWENPPDNFPAILFTGDTIFLGSLGGCLPGRLGKSITNIRSRILNAFEPLTILAPGHGPATTISDERSRNPFF